MHGVDYEKYIKSIIDILRPLLTAYDSQNDHYPFCAYSAEQLQIILSVLKSEKQIAEDTRVSDFQYICSYTQGRDKPSGKIVWLGNIGTLAHLIDDFFELVPQKFKLASQIFDTGRGISDKALAVAKSKGSCADKYDLIKAKFTKRIKHAGI